MSVGKIDLSVYNDNEAVADQFDETSGKDQVKNKMVSVSGSYVMEVSTLCFRNKKKGNLIISPTLSTSKSGGINLVASLVVVDGTPQVEAGDYMTVNIPVWPNPKATKDAVAKMFGLSKPRMCALLGVETFKINLESLVEKFSTEWDEVDDKFVLTKDHALKGKVVCVFEDAEYNNRPTLNMASMRRFKEGDVSVSNGEAAQSGFGSSSKTDIQFDNAAEEALKPSDAAPQVIEEDNLPF